MLRGFELHECSLVIVLFMRPLRIKSIKSNDDGNEKNHGRAAEQCVIIIIIIIIIIVIIIIIIILNPRLKNTGRWSKKNKKIVVAGMNTNPGGVPTKNCHLVKQRWNAECKQKSVEIES